MATVFTSNLRLALPTNGTEAGTWGNTLNDGVTSLIDAAISGTTTVAMTGADYTLTTADGATDEARRMFIKITGAPGAARNVICPAVSKLYFVTNSSTGGYAQTFKTSAGTGISVPSGESKALYCDGTNVVEAITISSGVSLAGTNTWTGAQTFTNSLLKLKGSSTGVTTFTSANSSGTDYTITFPAVTATLATLGANTFAAAQNLADNQLTRAMLIDCGNTVVAKGNSGTSTQTYDYSAGSVQTSTATGNHTLATSNWPPTGNLGVLLILLTNGGAYTLTMPTINWIQPSGVVTTSFSTYLASLSGRSALQSSGTDQILWWTSDAGATIYGKLV